MTQEHSTDQELLSRFQAGDMEAFSSLVHRYRDRLLSFVAWVAPEQQASAEDIVQEVFVKVYKGAASFKGKSTFKTWLYAIARLTALDWRRSFYRSIRSRISIRIDPEDVYSDIPALSPDQAALFEKKADVEIIRKAVENLPEKFRAVLLLREWEDLGYEEIADVLCLPVGTVRSRIHNARAMLARSLKGLMYES